MVNFREYFTFAQCLNWYHTVVNCSPVIYFLKLWKRSKMMYLKTFLNVEGWYIDNTLAVVAFFFARQLNIKCHVKHMRQKLSVSDRKANRIHIPYLKNQVYFYYKSNACLL